MISHEVRLCHDAATTLTISGEFLRASPVLHNLILTFLENRETQPEPSRYWVATRDSQVSGVMVQTEPARAALLVPMEADTIAALVDAIADADVDLPGVIGDAATAASFAGGWTERRKSSATPVAGPRLYELAKLNPATEVDGDLRQADEADRALAEIWVRAFQSETSGVQGDPVTQVAALIAHGHLWLWQNGEAVSMLVARKPVAGVVRLSAVYTPPHSRGLGCAAACVREISLQLTVAGLRSILYTDLANPTSNSIYRRIGYRVVSEAIRYRFDPVSSCATARPARRRSSRSRRAVLKQQVRDTYRALYLDDAKAVK